MHWRNVKDEKQKIIQRRGRNVASHDRKVNYEEFKIVLFFVQDCAQVDVWAERWEYEADMLLSVVFLLSSSWG